MALVKQRPVIQLKKPRACDTMVGIWPYSCRIERLFAIKRRGQTAFNIDRVWQRTARLIRKLIGNFRGCRFIRRKGRGWREGGGEELEFAIQRLIYPTRKIIGLERVGVYSI